MRRLNLGDTNVDKMFRIGDRTSVDKGRCHERGSDVTSAAPNAASLHQAKPLKSARYLSTSDNEETPLRLGSKLIPVRVLSYI